MAAVATSTSSKNAMEALMSFWLELERHAREEAKDYLANKQLHNLFQCLLIGILWNKPADVLVFLLDCMKLLKEMGEAPVLWNTFLEVVHIEDFCAHEKELEDFEPTTFIGSTDTHEADVRIDLDALNSNN